MSAGTEWFEGRSADEPPKTSKTVRPAWLLYTVLAALLIVVPMALGGCSSPCTQSEEIVTVLAVNETHVMRLRGRVEMCQL